MFPEIPKDLYLIFYFEVLDLVVESIKSRFDQRGYQTYQNLQVLLIKAARGESFEEEYLLVSSFHGDIINPSHP